MKLSQIFQNFFEIFWKRRCNLHVLSGSRMNEADRHGMKRLPLQLIGTSSAGIQRVAKQRMTNASHVHTDLVSAPGLQFKLHVCIPLKTFQNLVMGDGRLAVFLIDLIK